MTLLRRRTGPLVLSLAAALATGAVVPLRAQEPAAEKPAEAKPARKPASGRRVPPFFSKVGISTEQRERIYAIRGPYQERIAALQAQIDELKTRELADCEAVLTDAQRQRLQQERSAGRGRARGSVAQPAEAAK